MNTFFMAVAEPAATFDPHFARPPYCAAPSGGQNDWWFVANRDGYNGLQFPSQPGAKFTTEAHARRIAAEWSP